jgi:hypothetical protein
MYEYDADDEYDINDEEDRFESIEKQVFINIGAYMEQIFNEPRDNMCRVLAEIVALHGCKEEPMTQIIAHVGTCRQPIRSIDSDLFSLCSEQTDDTVFKYYISDDDDNYINIELT